MIIDQYWTKTSSQQSPSDNDTPSVYTSEGFGSITDIASYQGGKVNGPKHFVIMLWNNLGLPRGNVSPAVLSNRGDGLYFHQNCLVVWKLLQINHFVEYPTT